MWWLKNRKSKDKTRFNFDVGVQQHPSFSSFPLTSRTLASSRDLHCYWGPTSNPILFLCASSISAAKEHSSFHKLTAYFPGIESDSFSAASEQVLGFTSLVSFGFVSISKLMLLLLFSKQQMHWNFKALIVLCWSLRWDQFHQILTFSSSKENQSREQEWMLQKHSTSTPYRHSQTPHILITGCLLFVEYN